MSYEIIEVGASSTHGSTRDYGVHPFPLEHTEEFELPILKAQQVPEEIIAGEDWLKWGRWKRDQKALAWHHYAADVKISTLLRNPQQLVESGAVMTTEINASSYGDDPLPVALASLWRKRCITRYWQDTGLTTSGRETLIRLSRPAHRP